MSPDLWSLYRQMLRSRLFEEAVAQLWREGQISGEMHMSIGEEAVVAGVVEQLREGDAMALDHRGTAPLVMRGVDLVLLLRELLGRPDGLCSGMGGHMHLFSQEHLAASSGIVGASGPAAAGFGLAAQRLRPGTLAVAFFGEGAVNQGMLLEAMNLAVVWKLPVLFVCKDNGWCITTQASSVVVGALVERARGFGMPAVRVDGTDVEAMWQAVQEATQRARDGEGPTFLHALCVHLEGHFLGDAMVDIPRRPVREMLPMVGPMARSFLSVRGAPLGERMASVRTILATLAKSGQDLLTAQERDPLKRARGRLASKADRLQSLEAEVAFEIAETFQAALLPA